jgi:NADP-dependent 3-hydroxy acid dehydrogenase YdfG
MTKLALSKQTAIVTGGSTGYGAGIAAALRDAGADVWITGRNRERLESAAAKLGVRCAVADVTQPADWDRLFNQVGRVDILVNNAGAAGRIQPLADQSDDAIIASLVTNLTGAAFGCARAARVMKRQKSGVIINVSSVCAKYAWPGWSVYSAAKAGLGQLTKCLYAELREHGVRVTTLIPSWGATEFAATPDLAGHPVLQADIRSQCIQPRELGEMVVHICALPPHLNVLEYTVVPRVQDIMPL